MFLDTLLVPPLLLVVWVTPQDVPGHFTVYISSVYRVGLPDDVRCY